MNDRRAFLAACGVLALQAATGRARFPRLHERVPLDRIGLQLYTVRAAMAKDLPGTLAAVAAIGYREVEFAGYFGHTPAAVRDLLRRHALASPSVHVPFAQLDDGWSRALEEANTVGHQFVTIPWLPTDVRGSLDAWRRVADRLNAGGEQARAAGLRLAYHNHDFEFEQTEGGIPFDLLLAETDPALVAFELDLYWAARTGHEPLGYLVRHPGRFPMLHLKDSAGPPDHRMVDVGAGVLDFRAILSRARADGATHFFVEHDRPSDPMASVRASYEHLTRLEL